MSERIAALMLEKKHLHANVDFYSTVVYFSLSIPTATFSHRFSPSPASPAGPRKCLNNSPTTASSARKAFAWPDWAQSRPVDKR